MKKFKVTSILILLSLAIYFLYHSINVQAKTDLPKVVAKQFNSSIISSLHSGDLIFREGRGVFSDMFKKLSLTNPAYSHVGIIHKEKENTYVYHVIGGLTTSNGNLRKELLKDFIEPVQANSFAVYRFDIPGSIIDSTSTTFFSGKIFFDSDFDLQTDDKMYCTEWVYKIINKISGQDNFIPLTELSGIRYVACDNIFLSTHAKKIFSFNYYNLVQ